MCIRDRRHCVRWEPQARHLLALEVRERLEVRPGLGDDPHPCLLYTSDAADERSSVDLGGRRIIKKKKTDHITVRTEHIRNTVRENTR